MSAFTSRSKHRAVQAACIAVLGLAGVAHAADTIQNFDAIFPPPAPPDRFTLTGVARQINPGPGGGFDGKGLEITPNAAVGGGHGIGFNTVIPAWTSALQIDLDLRFTDKTNGADGMGLALLNNGLFGGTGVPVIGEDPNFPNSFGVGFDTWNNEGGGTGGDGVPGEGTLPDTIGLHFNGAPVPGAEGVIVKNPATNADIPNFLERGQIQHATIRITPNLTNDGSLVTVFINDPDPAIGLTVPYDNFNIPGLLPYEARLAFGARTGGEFSQHLIDNVTVTIDDSPTAVFSEDFEAPLQEPPPPPVLKPGGTNFVSAKRAAANSDPAGELFPVNGDGSDMNGGFRVTREAGNQHNTIAFDTTSEGGSLGIVANASLRFRSAEASRADGGSFMLLDTAVYGDTGAAVPYDVAEGPNAAGVFAIGFDTFEDPNVAEEPEDNDGNIGNHTSLHWNGAEVAGSYNLIPRDEFDLVGADFRQLTVALTPGVGGTLVTALLGDRILYTDFFVPGLDITTTELRAAFAGRTGGAFDNMEIDNVNVSFIPIPEPTSIGLLGLAGAGMCLRRRRA